MLKTKGTKIKEFFADRKLLSVLIMAAAAAAICALYAGSLAGASMPPSEGWYSYYAYLINEEGAIPYLDFELLFPPPYVYLIALYTKIFGYKIIALRIFGVIIFSLTGVFASLIFYRLFKNYLAGLICGLLTVSMLQSEVAQIFYDYIRIMDLCVYISVYFFLRYLDKGESRKPIEPNCIVSAVFAVFASLIKQSSGLIFLMFIFCALLFLLITGADKKKYLFGLLTFFAVSLLIYGIMFLLLLKQGALSAYIYYNFKASVAAKGGTFYKVLFGWIERSQQYFKDNVLIVGMIFFVIAILLAYSLLYRLRKKGKGSSFNVYPLAFALFSILLAALLIVNFTNAEFAEILTSMYNFNWVYYTFLTIAIFFAATSVSLIIKRPLFPKDTKLSQKFFFLTGVAFVLAYAVGTSGGLSQSQVALCAGLITSLLFFLAKFSYKTVLMSLLAFYFLIITTIGFSYKTQYVYSWWELYTGTYFEQTYETEVPLLEGIRVNKAYADMYNNVYRGIIENSDEDDKIFVMPHTPIIYLMTGRERATFTAVQWFDVSTDKAVLEDIDKIKAEPPKIIVICSVPDYVISSHERYFRDQTKSALNIMQRELTEFVKLNNYTLLSSDKISDGYTVSVYCLQE